MEVRTYVHNDAFAKWAKDKEDVVVLSGDLSNYTELKAFAKECPDRLFNMGMAEQNMPCWAGGLAREGFVPMIYTFGVFATRRAFDHLSMSIAYPNLNVKIYGFCPGITTNGGATHQGIDDIALMRAVPNMTVLEMGDITDIETVNDIAYNIKGPVYIRSIRGRSTRLFPADEPMVFNSARVISEGTDVTLLTSGMMTEEALRVTGLMQEQGLSIQHLHVSTLKPFTDPKVVEACQKSNSKIITYENHLVDGGLGTAVSEVMTERGIGKPLVKIGLRDTYGEGADTRYMMEKYGMDWRVLVAAIESATGKKFDIQESDLPESSIIRIHSI